MKRTCGFEGERKAVYVVVHGSDTTYFDACANIRIEIQARHTETRNHGETDAATPRERKRGTERGRERW